MSQQRPSEELQGFRFRASPRVPYNAAVGLRFDRIGGSVEGVTSDLSTEGMFVATADQKPIGTLVQFEFEDEHGDAIQGLADIVWVREQRQGPDRESGMGLHFRYVDPKSRERISGIVRSRMVSVDSEDAPVEGQEDEVGVQLPGLGAETVAVPIAELLKQGGLAPEADERPATEPDDRRQVVEEPGEPAAEQPDALNPPARESAAPLESAPLPRDAARTEPEAPRRVSRLPAPEQTTPVADAEMPTGAVTPAAADAALESADEVPTVPGDLGLTDLGEDGGLGLEGASARRPRRTGLVLTVILVGLVVLAGYLQREQWLPLLGVQAEPRPGSSDAPAPAPEPTTPAAASAGEPAASQPTPADARSAEAEPASELGAPGADQAESLVDVAEPVRREGPLRVRAEAGEGRTVVRIEAPWDLVDEDLTGLELTRPPRFVLKVRGASEILPATVGTAEVRRLRFGVHEVDGVPEVHLVFDLETPQVKARAVASGGDIVVVLSG